MLKQCVTGPKKHENEQNSTVKSFRICTLHHILLGSSNYEMDGGSSSHGRGVNYIQNFSPET
jgi:hypothetical protein